LLHDAEALFGFYPVREHKLTIKGEAHAVYDLRWQGHDALPPRCTSDPDAMGTQYVQQAREWFDSMWDNVARETAS
jgi:hypothetical protein